MVKVGDKVRATIREPYGLFSEGEVLDVIEVITGIPRVKSSGGVTFTLYAYEYERVETPRPAAPPPFSKEAEEISVSIEIPVSKVPRDLTPTESSGVAPRPAAPEKGLKFDSDKLDWSLLPPKATAYLLREPFANHLVVSDVNLLAEFRSSAHGRSLHALAYRALGRLGTGFLALEPVVQVMAFGAKKYGRDNWKLLLREPNGRERYIAAVCRHLAAVERGEATDPESGLPHNAHALTGLLFLMADTSGDIPEAKPAKEAA